MSKQSGVKGGTVNQVSRRRRALDMLTSQLEKGTKHNDGVVSPLTEKDITRIKKEIVTLKSRI